MTGPGCSKRGGDVLRYRLIFLEADDEVDGADWDNVERLLAMRGMKTGTGGRCLDFGRWPPCCGAPFDALCTGMKQPSKRAQEDARRSHLPKNCRFPRSTRPTVPGHVLPTMGMRSLMTDGPKSTLNHATGYKAGQ